MALDFYNLIKTHAERAPDHPAIIDDEVTLSYGQLLEQAERFAGGLNDLELNPQSKLGLLCLNQ
jgi:non-ribosomal peptide synthetase component E (peptide arylation enzyme)